MAAFGLEEMGQAKAHIDKALSSQDETFTNSDRFEAAILLAAKINLAIESLPAAERPRRLSEGLISRLKQIPGIDYLEIDWSASPEKHLNLHSRYGRSQAVKLLLEEVPPDSVWIPDDPWCGQDGCSPTLPIFETGSPEVAKLLLGAGMSPDISVRARGWYMGDPKHLYRKYAVCNVQTPDALQVLIDAGAQLEVGCTSDDRTPLSELVDSLLYQSDVVQGEQDEYHARKFENKLKKIELLLAAGADPEAAHLEQRRRDGPVRRKKPICEVAEKCIPEHCCPN